MPGIKTISLTLLLAVSLSFCCADVAVTFDTQTPEFTARDTYLSFNVDTGSVFNDFDFTDVGLRNLIKNFALAAPTQLRMGGSAADHVFFTGNDGPRANCSTSTETRICINTAYWDEINDFMSYTGMNFVFDVNLRVRQGNQGPWDPTNAEELLDYTASKGYKIAAWQLGNEMEEWWKGGFNITGTQIGADYHNFYKLLVSKYPTLPSTIYGPDSCCEQKINGTILTSFVSAVTDILNTVTIHDYPLGRLPDRSCPTAAYLIVAAYKSLKSFFDVNIGYIKKGLKSVKIPIVLGETASTAEGGCDGLSNRFVAGFVFIYELGSVAESHVVQMNRQDIAGWSSETVKSNYVLLGPAGWVTTEKSGFPSPHPDYFLAILWKQLVGTTVLTSSYNNTDVFDAHVWCSSGFHGIPPFVPVLTFLNVDSQETTVTVPSVESIVPRIEYFFTSTATPDDTVNPSSLYGDESYLNGDLLAVNKDGTLPQFPIQGRRVTDPSVPLKVPPYSYGFVVFEDEFVPACTLHAN